MRSLFFPSLLSLALLAALVGCDAADDPAVTSLLPDDARYTWSVEQRAVETDSLMYGVEDEVRVRVLSRNASVPGYRGLTEVEATTTSSPADSGGSRTWYDHSAGQLREVAYINAGATVLAEPRGVVRAHNPYAQPYLVTERLGEARAGSDSLVDSLIVRENPRVVYELPLEVGQSWVSFTDPFESRREVVGRETVTVAAGTFDCFVIRTEIGVGFVEEFEWLDYVSEEHGLVLRTIEIVEEYRGPDNQPLGLFRSVERLERTAER